MNKEILKAMAEKWEREAQPPQCEDDSDSAKYSNALAEGTRRGELEGAKKMREMIGLLG